MKNTYKFKVREVRARERDGKLEERVSFERDGEEGDATVTVSVTAPNTGYKPGQIVTLTLETA
jgi:hypothetical protein